MQATKNKKVCLVKNIAKIVNKMGQQPFIAILLVSLINLTRINKKIHRKYMSMSIDVL